MIDETVLAVKMRWVVSLNEVRWDLDSMDLDLDDDWLIDELNVDIDMLFVVVVVVFDFDVVEVEVENEK